MEGIALSELGVIITEYIKNICNTPWFHYGYALSNMRKNMQVSHDHD